MRILLACLTALLLTATAHAEGLPKFGDGYRAAQAEAAALPAYKTHNAYIGGVGGHAWLPDEAHDAGIEDSWNGGVVLGYLYRNGPLGLGIEGDYVLRDLGDIDFDDAVVSVRGRAGVYLDTATFVYGTAGFAEVLSDAVPEELSKGLVVGGGIERDIAGGLAVRAEVLHYRHGEDYTDWGDIGSTAGRVGLVLKF